MPGMQHEAAVGPIRERGRDTDVADYHWKAKLERDGFVHIPRVLEPEVVELIGIRSLQSVEDYSESSDLIRSREGIPLKLTYPLDKYPEYLPVLGHSQIREIVDHLLPRVDSVLTWEDVLIKMPFVGGDVGVHQDIGLDPGGQTVHSLGISLHHDGANPVFFLPGSHRLGPITANTVTAIWKDCQRQFLPMITAPGDVVIHDVHTLHYSESNSSESPRATWYLEFRSLRSLLERGPWIADWAYQRRAIWVYAREVAGDYAGDDEPDEVREHLVRLRSGHSSLRVPHVNGNIRYDSTSPYYHFSSWTDDWKTSELAHHGTHHISAVEGQALYAQRFSRVEKFHEPGLAPVIDGSGAYHITPDGLPAYEARHIRTFGFYEGCAAVRSSQGWFHILSDGSPLYQERYGWCGNFQENRCAVRLPSGDYFHITGDGSPAYGERYRYCGDFKDGYAVVQREDGRHTHIDPSGNLLHGRWFQNLDAFHKRSARACDSEGWHHVDMTGEHLYGERFSNVEPFYNGQARVQGLDGSLSVINESGGTLQELKGPSPTHLESLSGDMVGFWRTQTIHAAVELGIFECLPASAREVERRTRMHRSVGVRLMRALTELELVCRDVDGLYHPTDRGSLLMRSHPISLSDAAGHWGRESYQSWSGVVRSLQTGESALEKLHGKNFFDWLQSRPGALNAYHAGMSAYARHDYRDVSDLLDLADHGSILDAGGGAGELAFALLRSHRELEATIMDRAEVVEVAKRPAELAGRCRYVAGDLFQKWPVESDVVFLARVLHDWPDGDALRILRRAREAMPKGGTLYVIEMVLEEATGRGGLLDLNMLVMTQGAERTEKQFRDLLVKGGFDLLDVVETNSVSSILHARAL